MDYSLQELKLSEFKTIYKRVPNDFADGEYAPYSVLYRQLEQGVQRGFLLRSGGLDAAYAVCADGTPSSHVLLSLLATFEEKRGGGVGSAFLEKLKELYSDRGSLIAEVEKPEYAADAEEKLLRERRIRFYQRAGFLPIAGIEYTIWDVPMDLLVFPIRTDYAEICGTIEEIMFRIYLSLMGRSYIGKLRISRLNREN